MLGTGGGSANFIANHPPKYKAGREIDRFGAMTVTGSARNAIKEGFVNSLQGEGGGSRLGERIFLYTVELILLVITGQDNIHELGS